jgi:tripartite-type tricarboxylate transporter receptor subunit TctC
LNRLTTRALRAAAFILPFAIGIAHAQDFPNHPIRMIVPFPPGGGTDVTARLIGAKMGDALGQPVVIENRPGANGILGTELAAKAPGDGYTVVMGTMGSFSINPSAYKKMPFSVAKDLAPVSQVVSAPFALTVNPQVPAKNIAELVAYSKTTSSGVTFASSGSGSGPHMAAEMFCQAAGIKMLHVPYKGSAPAFTDLLGGQVQANVDSIALSLQHVRAGKLRALAVLSAKRSALLPDVPIAADSMHGFVVTNWYALMAPAATPLALRKKIQASIALAMKDPKIRAATLDQALEPVASTPEDFGVFLNQETARWAEVVKRINLQMD